MGVSLVWALTVQTGCLVHESDASSEGTTSKAIDIDRLEIISGGNQADLTDQRLLQPLRVRLLGRRPVNFLGRKLKRKPARDVPIQFRVADADGADEGQAPQLYEEENSETGESVLTVKTDKSGEAQVWVRLGQQTGDWEIEADVQAQDVQVQRVRFHVAAGVRRVIRQQESVVGRKLQMKLELTPLPKAAEPEGDPAWHVVYRVVSEPPGADGEASLKNERDKTNDSGAQREATILTLGDTPGVYLVLADITPPPPASIETLTSPPRPFRGVLMRFVAMDWVAIALRLATGILVFVIGVRLVGSGVLLLMSQKLDLMTVSWTQNRWLGFVGGALNGAALQSSSLVTSHLASLSNGGLVHVKSSLGLLAGAAVGATLLPQILALDIGVLAAPLLVLGAVLLAYRRRTSVKSWSWILLGAGLTIVAWNLLASTSQLATLSNVFRNKVLAQHDLADGFGAYAFTYSTYFIGGILLGFVLRTSNLVVVLAMLLAKDQALLITSATPLVLGANLGAAGMVFLTTLGKKREALRLCLASLHVQAISCLVVTTLMAIPVDGQPLFLRFVEALAPGELFPSATNVEQHIAVMHTLHNLLAGVLVLLVPALHYRLTDRMLPPSTTDTITPHNLDPQLIEVPALALRQAAAEAIYLTEIGRKTVAEAFDSFRYQDLQLSDQVVRRSETMTGIYRNLSLFLVEVSESQLHRVAAGQLEILQGAAESQVRIGELAERLRELSSRRSEEQIPPSEEADRDLAEAYDLVVAQFGNILSLLREKDSRTEENAAKLVERLAKSSARVESYWRQRVQTTPSSAGDVHIQTLIYREAFEILLRIAEQLAHVAQRMRLLTTEHHG